MSVFYLKSKFYALATGDYSAEERDVQFARKVSHREFEKQKNLYTQEQVLKLT